MSLKLLEPGKIGKMTLKNRVIMCPMGNRMSGPDGSFSARLRDFYAERARGGTGMITTCATNILPALEPLANPPEWLSTVLDYRSKISGLNDVAEAVHEYGAKLSVQLNPGVGRVGKFDSRFPAVSASAVPTAARADVLCRPLTKAEIKMIVEAAGNAAALAKAAEADAVEINGYGGYLMDQFMSTLWNKRTDEYGGDLDGRMRFTLEFIQSIQKSCGADFPIIFKYTPFHGTTGGREIEEGVEIGKRLQSAGVAALDISLGCYEAWYLSSPPVYAKDACEVDVAAVVKKAVQIPVIVNGKLGHPEVSEQVLQEGKVDFIGLGRPLLADPEWVNKVKAGRPDEIRPCIGCHEACLGRIYAGKSVSCAVNPACGNEAYYQVRPAFQPKRVLVIGGGVGGMETAVIAASRGHRVTIWEKASRLGGILNAAAAPEFKKDVGRLTEYLKGQLDRLHVTVKLMVEANPDSVARMAPDAVVIATGAEPIIPDLPGINKSNVVTAVDVLDGKNHVGGRVVVAGGGFVGCETAVFLADQGKKVTIVEMMDRLLPDPMFVINQAMLQKMVKDSGATVMTRSRLEGVKETGVIVKQNGTTKTVACDTVVLALGFRSNANLKEALEGKVPELFTIGDCVQPRRVMNAVWEGFHVARNL